MMWQQLAFLYTVTIATALKTCLAVCCSSCSNGLKAAREPVVASTPEGHALLGAATAGGPTLQAGEVPTGGTTMAPVGEPQVTPDSMEVVIDILHAEKHSMLSSYLNYWCQTDPSDLVHWRMELRTQRLLR